MGTIPGLFVKARLRFDCRSLKDTPHRSYLQNYLRLQSTPNCAQARMNPLNGRMKFLAPAASDSNLCAADYCSQLCDA
jgi:hypothetical protein